MIIVIVIAIARVIDFIIVSFINNESQVRFIELLYFGKVFVIFYELYYTIIYLAVIIEFFIVIINIG